MPGNGAVEHRQGGLRRALSAPQGSASRSIAAPARKPQQALKSSLKTDTNDMRDGAVAKVVEIGWWRSLWFVQRTISGVGTPAEITPWKRLGTDRP